ncbi:10480_t:CDS:1 [Acaulospora colombiana]|uniref:10480_t:CDS:1 n=1 Tax=Acaulospora colombiana TaxID=27376 RepID=A0ACA9KG38_9GLOM|nr:10480_t:CDS:1 [Acaulospora colombiana]
MVVIKSSVVALNDISDLITCSEQCWTQRKTIKHQNISDTQIGGRNQIEMYGSDYTAYLDPSDNRSFATGINRPVTEFCIVYIRGSPGTPNYQITRGRQRIP